MDREESDLLPGGLVTCLINNNEVTVVSLSPRKLTVRLCDDIEEFIKINKNNNNKGELELKKSNLPLKAVFYNFDKYTYEEVTLDSYELMSRKENGFYVTYSFLINNVEYSQKVKRIFRDYSKYVRLKNYGIDNEYSEEMVGYPAEEDYDFYKFYSDQKKEWMSELDCSVELLDNVELAISLHDDNLYSKFMKLDMKSFKDEYLRENYIENLKLFNKDITRVYIGNEFCHNLFPEVNLLMDMMDKAEENNLNITLCFTYLRDCLIEKTEKIIDRVYRWCRENEKHIEIVINDWGMIELLNYKQDYIKICLGVLLNKRKKDPRYMYKKGYEENKNLIAENSLNSNVFREFLKNNGIERYEYESCGYRMDIAKGNHSLHIPFYVTNTSQYCPLYAMCKYQDRGKQELVMNCPKYCKDYIFSYPKHLKMVGRYNSLFAFDDAILKDKNKIHYYISSSIDRIVMNFI